MNKIQNYSMPKLLSLSAFFLTSVSANAGYINFTISATSISTSLGYTSGQSITLTFVTGSTFGNTFFSDFTSSRNLWSEEIITDDQLFTTISGTGMGGSFIRPSPASEPRSYIMVSNFTGFEDRLNLFVGADSLTSIGLTTPSGATISQINAIFNPVTDFSFAGVYTDPIPYFHALSGVYSPPGSITIYDSNFNPVYFTATSLTITSTPVPEPAAYAAFLGLACLGLVAMRHRRS